MERINYFTNKADVESFLSQFNFIYYIPELNKNCRYYVELTIDLRKVYFCSVEHMRDDLIYNQDCFYDADAEYMIKGGIKIKRFMTKDEAEKYYSEMAKAEWYDALDEVYTFAEATEKYGLKDSTLRKVAERGSYGLIEGIDFRKSGKIGLITKSAMEKIYGKLKNE